VIAVFGLPDSGGRPRRTSLPPWRNSPRRKKSSTVQVRHLEIIGELFAEVFCAGASLPCHDNTSSK
jgi:hypothetical protein